MCVWNLTRITIATNYRNKRALTLPCESRCLMPDLEEHGGYNCANQAGTNTKAESSCLPGPNPAKRSNAFCEFKNQYYVGTPLEYSPFGIAE